MSSGSFNFNLFVLSVVLLKMVENLEDEFEVRLEGALCRGILFVLMPS